MITLKQSGPEVFGFDRVPPKPETVEDFRAQPKLSNAITRILLIIASIPLARIASNRKLAACRFGFEGCSSQNRFPRTDCS